MRNRAPHPSDRESGHTAHLRAAKDAQSSKKKSTGPSGRTLPFIAATCAFVLVLAVTFWVRSKSPLVVAPITDDDFAVLEEATRAAEAQVSMTSLSGMLDAAVHVGCASELMLEQIVEAGAEDERLLAEKMSAGHRPDAPATQSVGRLAAKVRNCYLGQLDHAFAALSSSAETAYAPLSEMLRGAPDHPLPQAVASLPRTVFGWVSATTHIYSNVFTEYSLLKDDSDMHALGLLRSINLLSWSSQQPHLFNWSAMPCHKAHPTATKQWLHFCETSMLSVETTSIRRAASFEELIALHPHFAPFRLHHAVLLILREKALGNSPSALRLLRSQEERMGRYEAVDRHHGAIVTLLAAFATPVEQIDRSAREELTFILSSTMNSCADFTTGGGGDAAAHWAKPFVSELRPALFDKQQLGLLMMKLNMVLGFEFPVMHLGPECIDD